MTMIHNEPRFDYIVFEPVRVAVEYLSSFLYNDCTVMDHEVDKFVLALSNSIVDYIFDNRSLYGSFILDTKERSVICTCFRGYEILLEINFEDRLATLVCDAARHLSMSIAEVSQMFPDNVILAVGKNFCFSVDATQEPKFWYKGPRCHIGGKGCAPVIAPVLRLMPPSGESERPVFMLINDLDMKSAPASRSPLSEEMDRHSETTGSMPPSPTTFALPGYSCSVAPEDPFCMIPSNYYSRITTYDVLEKKGNSKKSKKKIPAMVYSETALARYQQDQFVPGGTPSIADRFKEMVKAKIQNSD